MFTAQTPCSTTEHAISAGKDSVCYPLLQIDRQIHAANAAHRHFTGRGRTCKPLRHVTRAGEERLREASKLFVEGKHPAELRYSLCWVRYRICGQLLWDVWMQV